MTSPATVATEIITSPKKPVINEVAIRTKLEAIKSELKIKGELVYPAPVMDFSDFIFDAEHTQGDKHPHNVSEEEARKFITEAYFALYLKKNNSYNFWGRNGATYVQMGKKKLRTSFKSDEFAPPYKKMIEVFENAKNNS